MKIADRLRNLLFCDQWAIGLVRAPIHAFLDPTFVPEVQWIYASDPLDFLADCFGVIDGVNRLILAERFTYRGTSHITCDPQGRRREGRGYITCIAIDHDGHVTGEGPAIDSGKHMSFPFTVHYCGAWYIIAEESSAGTVSLYKRDSTGTWTHVKELLHKVVIDPSVIYHSGQWWMFGTTSEHPNSELHIWCAERLDGTWEPHARNPVRNALYNTRPAGTPFLCEGHLYRPAQNNTGTYGGSIVINKVESLTRHTFTELPVRELRPFLGTPFPDGTHTLSSFGEWTLVDAKRLRLLPRVMVRRIIAAFRTRLSRVAIRQPCASTHLDSSAH